MAHSSFIDCEVGSSITENFMSEADLKVEIETQQVNDDENVAVEVLGQLSGNCDISHEEMPPLISIKTIKTEDTNYTYVQDVQFENCEVVPDVGNNVVVGTDDSTSVVVDSHEIITGSLDVNDDPKHDIGSTMVVESINNGLSSESAVVDCNNVNNIFDNEKMNYLICCTICGLTDFSNEIELQHHIFMTHNNIVPNNATEFAVNHSARPYKCDSCNTTFQRKSSLKNHLKIHTYGIVVNNGDHCVDSHYLDSDQDNKHIIFEQDVKPARKRRRSKKVNHVDQEEMPQFETLKLAGECDEHPIDTYQETTPVNNIFDEWNLSVNKPQTDRSANMISLKPISELTEYPTNAFEPAHSVPSVSVNKDKPYVCPFCNRTFAREKALLNHMRIHNDNYDLTLECQKCHDVFDDIISLQAHLVVCVLPEPAVTEPQDLPPDSPEYVPYDQKRYNFNNNTVDNLTVGEHMCEICNKRFKTRQKVFRHMWVHRKKIYTCEICGLPFPGIKYLDEHRLALHPSKAPFTCTTCGKSFMSKQGLTEHSRLHKGWSDQYFCSYCQKYFSSRQGFTIHGRIHTGERPYGCKYCPKSFRDGGTLKKHERIHTGERPHECPLCHKRYNQKVVLREHIRGVHIMKKNSDIDGCCPICSITNMDKEEMSEHMVRHSDELMKKVKQEFLSRQKSLEKFDSRGSTGINKKRRYRRIKRAANNDNRLVDKTVEKTDNHKDGHEDSDYVYPYRQPALPRNRRKISKRRAYDKRRLSNQKKKIDRFESKKTKKLLKYTKNKRNKANKKDTTNDVENSIVENTTTNNSMESGHFLDENCSESCSDIDNDDSKKCLEDFPDDMHPLKLLECEMCNTHFATKSELVAHVRVHI